VRIASRSSPGVTGITVDNQGLKIKKIAKKRCCAKAKINSVFQRTQKLFSDKKKIQGFKFKCDQMNNNIDNNNLSTLGNVYFIK